MAEKDICPICDKELNKKQKQLMMMRALKNGNPPNLDIQNIFFLILLFGECEYCKVPNLTGKDKIVKSL